MGKEPVRTCIVCRGKFLKGDLIRYVWKKSGPVADPGQVMDGRGCYCCDREMCLSQVMRSERRLRRVFRLLA